MKISSLDTFNDFVLKTWPIVNSSNFTLTPLFFQLSIQLTLAEFIKNGEWQKHINRMRKLYRKKRAIVLEAVQRELGEHVRIRGENSGPDCGRTLFAYIRT